LRQLKAQKARGPLLSRAGSSEKIRSQTKEELAKRDRNAKTSGFFERGLVLQGEGKCYKRKSRVFKTGGTSGMGQNKHGRGKGASGGGETGLARRIIFFRLKTERRNATDSVAHTSRIGDGKFR